MEKAGQDFTFAFRTDPDLQEARTRNDASVKKLKAMRQEHAKNLAAEARADQEENGDEPKQPEVKIDESQLRKMTQQKGSLRGYDTKRPPDPANNW